jgi:thiamine pyrophosphokinase
MQHENGTTIRIHPDEGAAEFEAEIGTEFSVFALSKCERVTIGGAKWNLDSQPLDFSTRGLHNLTTETHLKIRADGILAIIF